ncbi:MAG: response regulator [Natronospirillum sp.]|uniref:response regulator n=1 Tax=Natronospirillum sp. TaxID=2812955 RepID=UPI0025FD6D76|nr:response regulator [Natronospirillum sp.]MCH8550900.1 response regulator [Natronospirillum sp.]
MTETLPAEKSKKLKPLYKMTFLVVDDFPSARKSVRTMLTQLGIENIFEAANAVQAKKLLKDRQFDMVICDFNLGPGQDGQQLLEEMRTTGAITRMTQWIIITAETSRDMVMGAVEYQPDDYLAKPFAFDTFKLRLEKLVRRINELEPLLSAMDTDDHSALLAACEGVIETQPRYRAWARRILINALIQQKQLTRAEQLLDEVLEKRQQDWALYEKARIQMHHGRYNPAIALLMEVVNTNPNNVAAYDSLADCYMELGQTEKAQQALLNAVRVSPRRLERQRRLAEISKEQHDYVISTKAYREALTLASNTRHDTPDNYINLADTLNTAARRGADKDLRNASRQAQQVAQRLTQRFPENVPLQIKSRLIQAESLDIQGLETARDVEIDKVFDLSMRHIEDIRQPFALEVASEFYRFEKQKQGDDWVDALRKQHETDLPFQQKLLMLQSEPVSEKSRKRAATHNKAGNEAYRDGKFRDALKHFTRALEYSPRHPGLILNIVQGYFKLYRAEPEAEHIYNMEHYLRRLTYLPQDHYQYDRYQALCKRLDLLKENS